MRSWASDIYVFFARRPLGLFLICSLGLGLSFYLTLNLKLDKSLISLFPDSSAELRETTEIMDLAPFARTILVQLSSETAQAAGLLPSAADEFVAGLNLELMRPVDLTAGLEPMKLMTLLPALCGRQCRERLLEKIQPPNIRASLTEIKTDLSGSWGLTSLMWRVDPLSLKEELFPLFPAARSWPMPDPMIGYPVSDDGHHLLIIIRPLVSMNDPAGSAELMRNLERSSSALPAGLSAQIVGAQRHTAANAQAIEGDLALTLSLALVLLLAIYLFLVRSPGAFWLFLTPAVAVLAATAGLVAVFPVVSGLALGFGAAGLGIAEDYAVHVHFALRRSADQTTALGLVASPLLKSCLLCAAGFGVLLFSAIPAIRQLAFFSGLAIIVGYFWALVVLPHCPGMNRPREFSPAAENPRRPSGVGPAWLCFVALIGSCLLLTASVEKGLSVRNLGLSSQAIVSDQDSVEKIWQLEANRRIFMAEGSNLEEALLLAGRLTEDFNQKEKGSAASLAGLLPPADRQEENLAAWALLVKTHQESLKNDLAAAGLAAGFEPGAFSPFLSWFSSPSEPVTPLKLREAGLGVLVDNFLAQKNGREFALVLVEGPGAPAPPLSGRLHELSAVALERSLSRALAGEQRLLPFCVFICFGLLAWAFKNVSRAALAFIPALGGLAAVLLFQYLTGRPVGLVEAAALPLVICLGADYGIVVVSEFLENADLGAPKAIFVSGLSTMAGIGILILAEHPVLHGLGRTVFIGLAAAMPISIWLLPRLYYGRKGTTP